MGYLPIGDVARQFDCSPHLLSNWFYRRKLDDKRCPIVGGRRMIPAGYLPTIESMLKRDGYLPAIETREAR